MTKRELARLPEHQQLDEVESLARQFSSALNLYHETPDELVAAARESDRALDEQIQRWITPECHHRRGTCDHGFPAWFCREAEPIANALRRAARRYREVVTA